MSRRGREKRFREDVRQLYRDEVTVYYTSSMSYTLGSESYWRQHGWKVVDKTRVVGQQVIHALLQIAPVYPIDGLQALSGPAAADRRARFERFHASSEAEQQNWLWEEYLEDQFEIGDLDRRLAEAAGLLAFSTGGTLSTIAERRMTIGRDIWQVYQRRQRGLIFSMWRIPKTMSAALDHRFGLEVVQRFGYVPEMANQPVQEEES